MAPGRRGAALFSGSRPTTPPPRNCSAPLACSREREQALNISRPTSSEVCPSIRGRCRRTISRPISTTSSASCTSRARTRRPALPPPGAPATSQPTNIAAAASPGSCASISPSIARKPSTRPIATAEFGGYDAVMAHSAYADYLRRRKQRASPTRPALEHPEGAGERDRATASSN